MGKQSRRKYEKRHAQPVIFPPTEPYASMTEKASDDDRDWFASHPDTNLRIRPYFAGEFRDYVPPVDHVTLVYQYKPGHRVRMEVTRAVAEAVELGVLSIEDVGGEPIAIMNRVINEQP